MFKKYFDDVNLVKELDAKNVCRLCYHKAGNKENLEKHQKEAHQDEKESLSRAYFTILDLVFRCELCPQIPGYLTSNLRDQHSALKHKTLEASQQTQATKKPSNEKVKKCNLCYNEFSSDYIYKAHVATAHREDKTFFNKEFTD